MGMAVFRTSLATRYMNVVNLPLQAVFTPYLMACAPETYSDHRLSFRASSLSQEEEMSYGFHTGQAVVYNEILHQHLDENDTGVCFTFCTSTFEGGYMYFPDLDVAFQCVWSLPFYTDTDTSYTQIHSRHPHGLSVVLSLSWGHYLAAHGRDFPLRDLSR